MASNRLVYPPITHLILALLPMLAALMVSAPAARGQSLGLPPEVRTATDIDSGQQTQIDTFVQGLVATLTGANPKEARQILILNASNGPNVTLTSGFLDAYAASVNTALQAALAANPDDRRVRLNIAIIAAGVAEKAGNARLQPTVDKLLKDSCEAVVLWGIRAAHGVLPYALGLPALAQGNTLVAEIIGGVRQFPADGDIAREAYTTLTPAVADAPNQQTFDMIFGNVFPGLMQLMDVRMEQYQKGIPADPVSEAIGVRYAVESASWADENGAQKGQVIQQLVTLLSNAAQRAAGAKRENRGELVQIINETAGALEVAAPRQNANAAAVVTAPLEALRKVTIQTDDKAIAEKTDAAIKALVDSLPGLNAPPVLAPLPTTMPTTGAATAPATTEPAATAPSTAP